MAQSDIGHVFSLCCRLTLTYETLSHLGSGRIHCLTVETDHLLSYLLAGLGYSELTLTFASSTMLVHHAPGHTALHPPPVTLDEGQLTCLVTQSASSSCSTAGSLHHRPRLLSGELFGSNEQIWQCHSCCPGLASCSSQSSSYTDDHE